MRWRAMGVGLTAAVAMIGLAAPATATTTCQDVSVPAQLDLLLTVQVHGRLCVPAGADKVQLLVHGATYDSRYWDEPVEGNLYSYVREATVDGWATLAVDLVGYGQSTKVPSATLTATTQALVVHQLIGKLRAGTIGGHAFPRVLLSAHSVGGAEAVIETSLYNDADALAVSGMSHMLSVPQLLQTFTSGLHPVTLDPSPLATQYDPGYLTTVPGTRGTLFYGPDPDPVMVAYDEATKGAISGTEAADAISLGFVLPTSRAVHIPVYLVLGDSDKLYCSAVLGTDCTDNASLDAQERPYFANASSFTAVVVPDSGHDVNLSPNAVSYETALNTWADTHI
ncbi:alpha/beta hydrolase [Kutzneria kofuensis]|uniref:Pimeloyl-ACP methyl ester carboxylesterase n=1 Tax=Kutzneria kofuensis TaxID=103725 RepID=A0A7W9KBM9_9PSEU|nr:alpha/beta hydrolase [Kutzneria kofuensis]MBB5889622.1 pimeloyl-ACP methyl ester carboxylesterase [Kutzneria kofuensis]